MLDRLVVAQCAIIRVGVGVEVGRKLGQVEAGREPRGQTVISFFADPSPDPVEQEQLSEAVTVLQTSLPTRRYTVALVASPLFLFHEGRSRPYFGRSARHNLLREVAVDSADLRGVARLAKFAKHVRGQGEEWLIGNVKMMTISPGTVTGHASAGGAIRATGAAASAARSFARRSTSARTIFIS